MNHQERKAWLASLKVGDEVAVTGSYTTTIARVTRTTATLIIIGDTRYRRDNGRETPNHAWHNDYLKPATAAVRAEIEERKLRARSENISFRELSLDKIRRILAIVEEGGEA